jgi:magnesium chelatase family protein
VLARVHSGSLVGIDAYPVEVEVDVYQGLPSVAVVGLPDNAVKESAARVKSAIVNSGYPFPARRITVNLAPADLRKEGSGFDLPIALGILAALNLLPSDKLKDYIVVGELALDGRVKSVRGALSLGLAARDLGFKGLILPEVNASEAAVVEGVEVLGVPSLLAATGFLMDRVTLEPAKPRTDLKPVRYGAYHVDFRDVRGPPGYTPQWDCWDETVLLWLCARSGLLITRSPMPASSAEERSRGREKFRWPITACCFWTSCPSSARTFWKSCANRSRTVR